MQEAILLILKAASDSEEARGMSLDAQTQLAEIVQGLSRSSSIQPIFQKTLTESSLNIPALEHNLQTVIEAPVPPPVIEDVNMEDVDDEALDNFTPALESLTNETLFPSSFLSKQSIPEFDNLVQVFALAGDSDVRIEQFTNLPILGNDPW